MLPDSFPTCGAIGARFDCEKFSQIGEGYMPPQIKNTQKTAKADAKKYIAKIWSKFKQCRKNGA